MNDAQKALLKKILLGVAGCFLIFYLSVQVYRMSFNSFSTVTATNKTVNNSVTVKAFIVRDEKLIDKTASGSIVPVAQDGKRVSSGDLVALSFGSENDTAIYMRMQSIEDDIERLEKLNSSSAAANIDLDKLNGNINDAVGEYAAALSSGELGSIGDASLSLRDSIINKQILLGRKPKLEAKIQALKKELEELKKTVVNYSEVKADGAGYYISSIDGYESWFDFSKVEQMTPEQIEQLLSATPPKAPENAMGKLVTGFDWYILCTVDLKYVSELQPGKKVTVNFPYAAAESVEAKVVAVNPSKASTAAVIIECNLMNEEIAGLRLEDVEIVINKISGYKVPTQAVRVQDGEKGVFILRANAVTFRKIDIVYSEPDFVIASADSENNELRLYDEIIVKGKDLKDGQVI